MRQRGLSPECARGDHRLKEGPRNPEILHCEHCSYRFPCRDEDCGHLDCMERRGQLSLCHYCRRRVEGPCGGFGVRPCKLLVLEAAGGEDATWTIWSVHGVSRAVHYACRSAHASPAERARWGESIAPAA